MIKQIRRFAHGRTVSTDLLVLGTAVAAVVVVAGAASAGTDTTFNATTTILTNWSTGSLGKMTGVAAVGAALIGLVMKFDWRLVGGALGIGLAASTGPGIVSGLMSATF